MKKKLTAHEKYLFLLTSSTATTDAAKRVAIKREGLAGLSKKDILAERRKAFAEFRERPENADIAGLPVWLAAARFADYGNWRRFPPIKAGTECDVPTVAAIAHDLIDWGRQRKHSRGTATANAPRVREDDNGKPGWNRVVFRYADYLCVLSPDKTTIAVQAKRGKKIELHRVRNGWFIFDRRLCRIPEKQYPDRENMGYFNQQSAKRFARILCRLIPFGWDCGELTEKNKRASEVVIREQSSGELYHIDHWNRHPSQLVSDIADKFRKRATEKRLTERNRELDEILKDRAAFVFVQYDDSIAAGNCEPRSQEFREQLHKQLAADGELGAVRADVILSQRDDDYTRRACRVAALRRLKG